MAELVLFGFGSFTFVCGYLVGSKKIVHVLGLEDKNDK